MSSRAWIGVDLGTQSVRAVALADDGTLLGAESEPLDSHRVADRHEQLPTQWWAATAAALRRLTAGLTDDHRPTALAVSGTSGTIVALATDGQPRSPGIMYDDRRGSGALGRVTAETAALAERLGYRMQVTWALPKIVHWFDEQTLAPDVIIGHQPDVITSALAGRLLPTDASSALKSGVDLDALAWPEDAMGRLGVDPARLNTVVASGTVIGEVDRTGAEATGLPVGCRLVAGMTDGCAAQIAAGALRPGSWNSVLGTTLVLKGAAVERRVDRTGAIYAHRAPFDGGWFPGGASSTGARAIGHWLPGRGLSWMTAELDLREVPVAYPLVGQGERFPFVADEAEAFFPKLRRELGDVERFASILGGVAWLERLAFDLVDLTGYDQTGPVLLTGGGSRNPVWNQLRADVLGRRLELPGQSEGAAGMAVLAAAAVRDLEDDHRPDPLESAAARLLPPTRVVEPDFDRHDQLSGGYRAFVQTLDRRGWLDPRLRDHALNRSSS